jgi:hypothetical protein
VYKDALSVYIPVISSQLPHPPPTSIMPNWTHTFVADSNSSDRVRAASVTFLSVQHPIGTNKCYCMSNVYYKKAAKQKKFLAVVVNSDSSAIPLTADEIVFDGTASHPTPLITPPMM